MQVERAEERLLVKAYREARDLDKKDEAAAREQDVRDMSLKMREVRNLSYQAYRGSDPEGSADAADARIALARVALAAYNPRTGEAEAMLEPLLKLTPPPREALFLTAIAEWYSGDLDHALEHVRLLTNVAAPRREYLVTEAEILIAAGRWPEAREVADKLEKTGRKRPEVRWVMGRVLLHEGHVEEALDQLQNIFTSPRDVGAGAAGPGAGADERDAAETRAGDLAIHQGPRRLQGHARRRMPGWRRSFAKRRTRRARRWPARRRISARKPPRDMRCGR